MERWWYKLNEKFENVETDAFIVMPNHFHGIIMIHNDVVGADPFGKLRTSHVSALIRRRAHTQVRPTIG